MKPGTALREQKRALEGFIGHAISMFQQETDVAVIGVDVEMINSSLHDGRTQTVPGPVIVRIAV